MDKFSQRVLEIINKISADGGYKVIIADDLLAEVSKKSKLDQEALRKIITYLSEEQCISCKFADGDTFCVCSMPKGRMYLEKKTIEQDKLLLHGKQLLLPLLISLVGGFLGALAAVGMMIGIFGV